MSERLLAFQHDGRTVAVTLPFELAALLEDWKRVQHGLLRELPAGFRRDEAAYLAQFLDPAALAGVFRATFGAPAEDLARVSALYRPRGPVAVWLPNNVSLLGPLVLVLLSLTGNELLLKGGSRGDDLAGSFLAFARARLSAGSVLGERLSRAVEHAVFERDDPRHAEWARRARVRVVFGSDAAAAAVEALEHPPGSLSFAFTDRRSEAWVEAAALDERLLETLLGVFAIYGQAGCTSPRRVVLLDATPAAARALRDRLVELWPRAVPGEPPAHVASRSVAARQWAAGLGWDARLVARHAAVLATGTGVLAEVEAPTVLPVVARRLEDAVSELPPNAQTVGHALAAPHDPRWLELVARSRVLRFVPLARMHHFGPVWDGAEFWRACFERVEVER
jgi:hypothetical protein